MDCEASPSEKKEQAVDENTYLDRARFYLEQVIHDIGQELTEVERHIGMPIDREVDSYIAERYRRLDRQRRIMEEVCSRLSAS